MWVASYGVMPHVYIVTSGPGVNGTTARRAVSYSRMGAVVPASPVIARPPQPLTPSGDGAPDPLPLRPAFAFGAGVASAAMSAAPGSPAGSGMPVSFTATRV